MEIFPITFYEIYCIVFAICLLIVNLDGFNLEPDFLRFLDKVNSVQALILIVDFLVRVGISSGHLRRSGFLGNTIPTLLDGVVALPYFYSLVRSERVRDIVKITVVVTFFATVVSLLFGLFSITETSKAITYLISICVVVYIILFIFNFKHLFRNDYELFYFLVPTLIILFIFSKISVFCK